MQSRPPYPSAAVAAALAPACPAIRAAAQAAAELQRAPRPAGAPAPARAPVYHCAACRVEQPTARACDVCAQPVMLGELFDAGPAAFVVVAGRWDDGERNTKLISAPLTLDAALVEYAACAGYPWRHIEYKGVCLDVWEPGQ